MELPGEALAADFAVDALVAPPGSIPESAAATCSVPAAASRSVPDVKMEGCARLPQTREIGTARSERRGAGPRAASVRVYNEASELVSEDGVLLSFPAPVEIVHPSAGESGARC